jgi:hypothetical protein
MSSEMHYTDDCEYTTDIKTYAGKRYYILRRRCLPWPQCGEKTDRTNYSVDLRAFETCTVLSDADGVEVHLYSSCRYSRKPISPVGSCFGEYSRWELTRQCGLIPTPAHTAIVLNPADDFDDIVWTLDICVCKCHIKLILPLMCNLIA